MQVDSIEPTILSISKANASSARAAKRNNPSAQPKPTAEPPTPPASPEAADPEETPVEIEDTTKTRGVIRLLEEGHFKGVADVRLRINFFDELAGKANAAAVSDVSSGANDLVESVLSQAQGLLDELGADEETQQAAQEAFNAFQQAAQQAVADSTSDGVVDREVLEAALKSAFDTMVAELRTLLAPPATTEEPSETGSDETDEIVDTDLVIEEGEIDETLATEESIPGEETVDEVTDEAIDQVTEEGIGQVTGEPSEPVVDLEAALASLTETFTQAVSDLIESTSMETYLPPLSSPPTGQGVAYDKFLAIYEGLLQGTTQSPNEPPEEPLSDMVEPPADPDEESPAETINDEPIDVIV